MKKIASILMAAAILCGAAASRARAAEAKPIAALAVASYNDLIGDINFVGGLVDRPQLGTAAEGFLAIFTQGKGLIGIDKSRPFGAIVQAAGEEEPVGYVCIPVTDFKAALELLKLYNTVDADGKVYKVTPMNGSKVSYLKEHSGWACFSDKADSLEHIVADPLSVLSDLGKNYIVSGRIFLANVPESLRDKFISGLKGGMEHEASEKKDDETDEQFAQRKKLLEEAETYLVRVAGDLNEVNLGWGLNRSTESTYIDLSVTAKPDTKTAEEMGEAAKAKTEFAGFHTPHAASIWSIAGPIPEAKQQILGSLINVVRGKALSDMEKKTPEDKREVAKEVGGEVFDLLSKIVKSGRIDMVGTGLVSKDSLTGLGACYMADGGLFDKILHTVAKAIEEDHPEVAQFVKLDAETVHGLKVHKISVPIPESAENRDKLVKYIGDSLEIVIAVGKENVYAAVGRDAGAKLKKAVEASEKSGPMAVPPVSVSYAVQPIFSVLGAVGKPHEKAVAKIAIAELKKTPGKDHVSLTVKAIPNGGQARLEVQGGVLRMAGRMAILKSEGKLPDEDSDGEK